MAIGWLTALKIIPWGDVIEAAPGIVKSARRMFTRTQATEAQLDAAAAVAGDAGADAPLQARMAQLEAALAQMAEQQQASAQLVESLAEQNAKVVEVVEVLRVRMRLALGLSAVLALLLVAVWWAR